MSTIETMNLDIDEKAYSYARIYASLLNDEYQRKRSYASIVALYAFINLVEKAPCNLQKAMTLFRNPLLNEQYEITDIYINNWHLDVRVITSGDAVLVPRIHYEENITPDYYVVIKIDKELKHAELLGFADVKAEKDEPFDYNYRKISLANLISYNEFLEKVKEPKTEFISEEDYTFFNENYLGIMDNDIGKETKNNLVRLLFNNSELRTEFCCFTGFEMVSCNSSKYDDLFNDNTLGIIGANDVNNPKYEGKEEQIDISDNADDSKQDQAQNEEQQQEEEPEETVSDILDELFGADENTIEPDTVTEKPVETIVEQTSNLVEDPKEEILDDNILDESDEISPINNDEDIEFIPDDDTTENIEEEEEEKLVLIDDNQEEINDIGVQEPDIKDINEENVQKVIVGYDEFGEPEYSYIKNVDQTEDDVFADIDAEPAADKENESLIEEIPDDDIISDITDNSEEINNVSDIEEITDVSDITPAESDIEKIDDDGIQEITDDDDMFVEDDVDNKEIKDTTEEEYPQFDDYQSDENINNDTLSDTEPKDESNIETINADIIDTESTEIFDDETEGFSEEKNGSAKEEIKDIEYNREEEYSEEKQNDDENFEPSEHDEDETGGEYEDDELQIPEEPEKKSSTRLVAGIVGAVVALGLIGGGTMFAVNHFKASNQTANAPIQENEQQNNNFDQQQGNEGFEGGSEDFFGGEGIPEENQGEGNPEGQENFEDQGNPEEQNPEENQAPDDGGVPPLTEEDLVNQPQNNNPNGDVNRAMVNTFSQGGNTVSMRGLNWFCATELYTDNEFKQYLQNLDNTLKQNLRNNLMNATETPANNSVTAKFAVRNDGNLEKVIISDSSGSGEIDDLVLRSINETFEGEKSQILDNSAQKADMYYLKVVIKL